MSHSAAAGPVFCLITVITCAGCRTAHDAQVARDAERASAVNVTAPHQNRTNAPGWHTIVHTPNPDKPHIRAIEKFNPVWWFGNCDQPSPPDEYRSNDKGRLLKWRMRNPFHNFTFYVIGVADKKFKRSGCYPELNFLPDGGWNFAVSRYRWCPRPFVSWCHGTKGFHFYCGWRAAGNFGFKCNVE